MTAAQAALAIGPVTLAVSGRTLFNGFSVTIGPAEIVTLHGPSGCGKSSLLAWIAGTLDPAFSALGRVRLGSRELDALPPERRGIAILFQDDLLFPHMTVAQNLAFALPRRWRGRARRSQVLAALDAIELRGLGGRHPATLSGGQRGRVALMRALLAEPQALLLDEPFAKLDPGLRDRIRRLVFAEVARHQLPTLLVTHDREDGLAAGGRVIEIEAVPPLAGAALSRPARGEP